MQKILWKLAVLATVSGLPASAVAQPNIIIVNIDDMGWGDFGSYGSDYSETPNMDQLAAEGTRFTQYYAGAPICSPSRASLFTGQYAARSGINSFINNSADNLARDVADNLDLSAPSMARAFHDNGYATGHFGKWHMGGGRDVGYQINPTPGTNVGVPRIVEYGYDDAWTQFEGLGNRIINVVDYSGANEDGVLTRPSAYFNGLNQASDNRGTGGGLDQIVYLERQYNATFMINRAIDFIDDTKTADPNKPFFMNVWLDEVHTPHDPPDVFEDKYNNDPKYAGLSQETRDYLAVLEYTDQQIGRLIDYVDQSGFGNETLILVMSDNGAVGGNANSIGSNGPFRGGKGSMYEGGVREPLIARWTGNVAAGRTDEDTVIWMPDLFPTLTGLAGVGAPPGVAFDGEDLGQALLGNATQTRTNSLFWNMNRGTAANHSSALPNGAGTGGIEAFALRSGNWKLLLNADGTSPELYDLSTDLGESNNLAFEQPAIVAQMASEGLAIRYSTPSRILPDAVTPLVQLRAENLAGLGNNAAVSSWSDTATGDSFNGSVSQSTSSNQPTLLTNALNGRAVVEFDGDDSLLSSTSNSLPSAGKGVTIVAVATHDTSGDTAERLGQLGSSNGTAGQVVGLDVSSTSTGTSNGGAGFRFNNGASLHDTPIADSGFHIVVWQADQGQAYADATMFVDGTLAANRFSGSSSSGSTSFSGSDLELILGTGRAANGSLQGNDHFTGQLAEFLVFNDQLSVGQINLVANYLSTEYALPFAYNTTLNVIAVAGLSWTGAAGNFDSAWNAGDGAGGLAGSNTDPFVGGDQDLYLGNGGSATFNNSTDTSAGSRLNTLRIGTAHAGFVVTGTDGDGTLTATGSKSLTIGSGSAPAPGAETGDLTIGEAGHTGALNWGSAGTLKVEGRLRIGQGGDGVFTQDAGIVTAGDTGGTFKFIGVGVGVGSSGVYNLNNGRLLPGGGLSGSELRQVRIGQDGAEGVLALGDGIGAAGSASIESNDDVFVGYSGGNGQLVIEADGVLTLEGSGAELRVGNDAGSTGLAVQYGGSVSTESLFTIGQGGGAEGEYQLNGGSISASGTVRVGGGGGTGTLRIGGNSSLVSSSSLIVGQSDNAGSEGLLEIVGSQATFQIARLTNHLGNDETIRWTADSGGVTPLVIVGSGGALRVELQNASEIAANSGTVGNRMGDGVALSLDLSALSGSQSVTLIDNRTSETVAGYFENGSTGDLYEEGEQVLGTGFQGIVTISYQGSSGVGTAGNDVVLTLVESTVVDADFDEDGDVDGADFLAWQRNVGKTSGAVLEDGDANGDGAVDDVDLEAWTGQFGVPTNVTATAHQGTVPEPATNCLIFCALLALRFLM
jgi:uncharacterized sulfatase